MKIRGGEEHTLEHRHAVLLSRRDDVIELSGREQLGRARQIPLRLQKRRLPADVAGLYILLAQREE
jgi:hypothetical protein